MPFDRSRNFNRASGVGWRGVRDREHRDDGCAVVFAFDRQHNDAGANFAPFFLSCLVLTVPKVGIGNDKASFGIWNRRHMSPLFWFEDGIQVIVSCIHA